LRCPRCQIHVTLDLAVFGGFVDEQHDEGLGSTDDKSGALTQHTNPSRLFAVAKVTGANGVRIDNCVQSVARRP